MTPSRLEYNIVVLGAGGVGKSCITTQFVQNIWIEAYDPTIEDSYRKIVEVDGKSCILEILDTAGTEQFLSMRLVGSVRSYDTLLIERREIYMKTGHGFLLVYSITNMNSLSVLADLRDQILRIKDADSTPMVLAGNKADLEEERVVSRNRAMHMARKWGNIPLYETSAKRKVGVQEVFVDLTRQMIHRYAGAMARRPTQRRRKQRSSCVIL